MRVLVAPDKFKGTMTAPTVTDVIAGAIESALPASEVVRVPIADGGEGTVDVAINHGFTARAVEVEGPLGQTVCARYARRGPTAVIESSAAAGLALLPGHPDPDSARRASSFGVGQLVRHACADGAIELIVGLGGSATTDGGLGMAMALGADVQDADGRRLVDTGGSALASVDTVDLAPIRQHFEGIDVTFACDVDNALLGPQGAASVYGPQKGATPALIEELEQHLSRWVDLLEAESGRQIRERAGAGAAGGMALPLLAATDAAVQPGIEVALRLAEAGDIVDEADVVVVGEGSLDTQSLHGKGPVGLARRAKGEGTFVIAVVGVNHLAAADLADAGVDSVYALTDIEPDLDRCLSEAPELLEQLAIRVASDLRVRSSSR